jgi:hypothetical protein
MAPPTRNQNETAFDHILNNVWGEEPSSLVYKTLQNSGCALRVENLVNISDEDVEEFKYIRET